MNTRKKILYVITKSNFGGAQRYVYELATNLPKETFEVAVAFGGDGLLKQKLTDAGIRTYTIRNFERNISIIKEIGAMCELLHIMRTLKPDIVHLNSSKAGGSGAFIARLCGIRNIIFTAHGWPFFEDRSKLSRSFIWLLSYLTVLLTHHTITVSQHDTDNARMPFVTKKIHMIHTGVSQIAYKERMAARTALFDAAKIKQHVDNVWAVAVSEHTKNKNLGMLIDALATYNTTSPHRIFLTLIGDGEATEQLRKKIVDTHSGDYVYITGYVDDARSYLHAFDLFVMPSLKEGLPYGLLEAGNAGLFPIASAVGGIPEVVTADVEGILIDPHDTTSLVRAFHQYTGNQNLTEHMRTAFHKKIVLEFNFEVMLKKTFALY